MLAASPGLAGRRSGLGHRKRLASVITTHERSSSRPETTFGGDRNFDAEIRVPRRHMRYWQHCHCAVALVVHGHQNDRTYASSGAEKVTHFPAPKSAMTREPRSVRLAAMTTLEDIEKAVTQLPADQLAKFRAWFEEFEAARFDRRIERDARAGRLDKLAEQALADFRAGRARDL
jgi:hypothetical protein